VNRIPLKRPLKKSIHGLSPASSALIFRLPRTHLLIAALLCVMGLPAQAREPVYVQGGWVVAANDDSWESMSPQEQKVLSQYRKAWPTYSPEKRAQLRKGAQRYLQLSPNERDQVQRERERFQRLDPQERQQLREKYKESRGR